MSITGSTLMCRSSRGESQLGVSNSKGNWRTSVEEDMGSPEEDTGSPGRERKDSLMPWSFLLDLNPITLHVSLLESYFRLCGLEPCVVQIDSETHIHCWVPSGEPAWHTTLWCGNRQRERKSSSRQPVLLLHGFGASAIWQWMHQVRALFAAGFDVYMPDLIFFGGSWSASTERSVEFQAQCMEKLMTALGVHDFHVNGISYGGFVAYQLSRMFPERVRSLALTNSGLLVTTEELDAMLERWGVGSTWELLLPMDPTGVQRLMDLAYHRPLKPPQWLLKKTLPVLFQNMVQEKRELLEHLNLQATHYTENVCKPNAEVLLLWGRHDLVFPLEIAERMKSLFGGTTELIVLEDASHVSNSEQSHEYNEAIIRFMERTGPQC